MVRSVGSHALRGAVAAAALAASLGLGGCSLLLDFSVHADAGPADGVPADAMLVPDPCGVLEPNDDVASAIALTTGETRFAAICPTTDRDFYKLTMSDSQTLDFKVLFDNMNGDLDMQLLDVTGTSVVAESRSFDDNEGVKCPNDVGVPPACPQLAAGDYIVKVFPAVGGVSNVYQLDVTISGP
jgi:hypothetical protein